MRLLKILIVPILVGTALNTAAKADSFEELLRDVIIYELMKPDDRYKKHHHRSIARDIRKGVRRFDTIRAAKAAGYRRADVFYKRNKRQEVRLVNPQRRKAELRGNVDYRRPSTLIYKRFGGRRGGRMELYSVEFVAEKWLSRSERRRIIPASLGVWKRNAATCLRKPCRRSHWAVTVKPFQFGGRPIGYNRRSGR